MTRLANTTARRHSTTGPRVGRGRSAATRCFSWALWLLPYLAGCVHSLPDAPPADHIDPCRAVPKQARNHVYIFLLEGFDPVCQGELFAVRTYLNNLGFIQTYSGQAYHAHSFAKEMKQLHKTDADARFVLIGTTWSRVEVSELIHQAAEEKWPLRLVLRFHYDPRTVPDPEGDKGAQFWCLSGGPDEGILQKLAWELAALAGTVPLQRPPLPVLPGSEEKPAAPVPPDAELAPPPRPVPFMPPAAKSEDWDALNPTYLLRSPPSHTLKASPRKEEARDHGGSALMPLAK